MCPVVGAMKIWKLLACDGYGPRYMPILYQGFYLSIIFLACISNTSTDDVHLKACNWEILCILLVLANMAKAIKPFMVHWEWFFTSFASLTPYGHRFDVSTSSHLCIASFLIRFQPCHFGGVCSIHSMIGLILTLGVFKNQQAHNCLVCWLVWSAFELSCCALVS